jgi:hypothetical protein
MPLAPEISVGPASTAPYSLTIAGGDVLLPAAGGNQAGTPLESISITERGPGGVSSMRFTYEDPTGLERMPVDGDEVLYWDRTNNVPLFGGFVQAWPVKPLIGGQGRSAIVTCVGFETLLDWAVFLAPLVIPAGTTLQAAIQSCAANATGTSGLRFGGSATKSSQALPVSVFAVHGSPAITLSYDVTVTAGMSLRAALALVARGAWGGFVFDPTPASARFTVDFYRGLRAMEDSAASAWATDYINLDVDDGASASRAEDLEHTTDASSIVRGVYIAGANAAGSGYASDGTGRPGRIAYINDPTIDTAAKLVDAQASYLNGAVIATRGTFDLSDFTPAASIRPGSILTLTDVATGATGAYRIFSIAKTFTALRQTWALTYGGLPPAATTLLRHLTRDARS